MADESYKKINKPIEFGLSQSQVFFYNKPDLLRVINKTKNRKKGSESTAPVNITDVEKCPLKQMVELS